MAEYLLKESWFDQSPEHLQFLYPKYLQAKIPIDSKAFHWKTKQHFCNMLESLRERTVRILDVGAGIGSMFLHLLDWKVLEGFPLVEYDMIDSNPVNVLFAVDWLEQQIQQRFPSFSVYKAHFNKDKLLSENMLPLTEKSLSVSADDSIHFSSHNIECPTESSWCYLHLENATQKITVTFYCVDIHYLVERESFQSHYQVVIGLAFIDLFEVVNIVTTLFRFLQSYGIFYFPITYDGDMYFQPFLSQESEVVETYHSRMDGLGTVEFHPGEHSQSGRQMIACCQAVTTEVEFGDSWWNVCSDTSQEVYFLACILRFMEDTTSTWLNNTASYFLQRRQHLKQKLLTYHARNIDCCGKFISG
eukprot:jgi/Galph1/759/GphlegSOOS_G5506.1